MRQKKPALIITFASTTDAMGAERYCAERGLPGRLIPVPKAIHAGCGLAWKAPEGENERFAQAFDREGLHWESMTTLELWG